MPKPWNPAVIAASLATALTLAGCGANGGADRGKGKVVSGGTFTMAFSADPGALDPQGSVANTVFQMSRFAYDSLVSVNTEGNVESQLASSWKVQGRRVALTLRKNIECASGQPFTAKDAAANLNYVADPTNKSPFGGTFIPLKTTATADEAAGTVTLSLPSPAPFVLNGLSSIPMVCAKGMADRKYLERHTDGTGPFALTTVKPNDSYTFGVHKNYDWGPDGATTSAKGTPAKVVVKVVPNESTAANLLLSGGLNAATIVGPDYKRLTKAGLFNDKSATVAGEMFFNHNPARPASDPAVRTALVQALDLPTLMKVLTSGRGKPPTQFAVLSPAACPGESVPDALPKHDVAAAEQALDAAGWKAGAGGVRAKGGQKLSLTLLNNAASGSAGTAAAELAVKEWKQVGVQVKVQTKPSSALLQALFSTGNWDLGWTPLNVGSPDQLVPFLSGPGAAAGGNNFAGIKNPVYDADVKRAMTKTGSRGCADWLAAESAVVKAADVVPFANLSQQTFGAKSTFEVSDALIPTSIRMRAS